MGKVSRLAYLISALGACTKEGERERKSYNPSSYPGYGMEQPVGHVDFYPNGGTDQPGCTLMDLPVNLTSVVHADRTADSVGRHLVACSHMRAVQLYIESLRTNQSCHMIGQECSTYEEYKLVTIVE